MANPKQQQILKQGVKVWNKWRKKNFPIKIDLSRSDLRKDLEGADFSDADLNGAYLHHAQLEGANLQKAHLFGISLWEADLKNVNLFKADLRNSDLHRANLTGANLNHADLSNARLNGANLNGVRLSNTNFFAADLRDANLSHADFTDSDLRDADFTGADLTKANLLTANLTGAILRTAKFSGTILARTTIASNDLSEVMDIENVDHRSPSILGINTIHKSKGKIPKVFLQGCGLSDADIEYANLSNPDLSNDERNKILYKIYDLQANQAIQVTPLFISYSHGDNAFVDKIGNALTEKGIRYWRDIHDMKSGRLETQIDRAIRQNPTVLLILSEHALSSDWVEHEVRTARGLEKELGRDTLCPVALDDSWKSGPWPKRVMEQIMEYNILDFSAWQDDSKFDGMFRKLIDGLELFYKG